MSWEDGGPLEPEPEVECPDCLGKCVLFRRDAGGGAWISVSCHRCKGEGMLLGEDASDVLQEQAELAAEERADEARDR